jgi:tripeptide aminopeptidase
MHDAMAPMRSMPRASARKLAWPEASILLLVLPRHQTALRSCTIISAMPFRPWTRWKSERAHAPALAEEVERLCADPRVHRLFDWFSRHEREISDLQLAITAVPAPSFAEQTRAAWLRQRLQPLGLVLSTDAVGNLLASRHGAHSTGQSEAQAPSIAVSAHLDTVFPASTPLEVRREQARLLGPGISDNGSGLAALWALAAAFHQLGIATALPLLFIANVGEEGEGNLRGIRHIYRERLGTAAGTPFKAEHLPGAAAGGQSAGLCPPAADAEPAPNIALLIALDGAGNSNIIAQALGSRRFEVVISGPGGHSWSDFGAPNPLVAAALAVNTLFRIPLPVNPRTTLNIGSIEGGTSINAIPARAVVKIDLRSSDSRCLDDLERQLRRAVANACSETQAHSPISSARLQYAIATVGERPAGELSAASPLLAAIRAVDAQLGIQSQLLRASTDANIPIALGLEAVSLGAGGSGGGAHTLNEWFDPAGREQGLRRLALLILLLAGFPPGAENRMPDSAVPSEEAPADPACPAPNLRGAI